MKKVFIKCLLVVSIGLFSAARLNAQDSTTAKQDIKTAAKKTGHAVKKTAKKVGNKTAELASKGKSAVVDKKYAGKQGPNGETIYIDKNSKYYWVDKAGHKNFVTATQLKDKSN